MGKQIGILTSGGDCPGLNAAIRGVCRAGIGSFNMRFIGFLDGFRGLVHNRFVELTNDKFSGILPDGGTIIGTSRDKPHRMPVGDGVLDMTEAAVETYRQQQLDALVCIGGGGTQKNAMRLKKAGLNIITLPKTIDNDVAETDMTFGFDTAQGIVMEAIDRLHSTAMSHNRVIVVEIMGHRAGWLALGAGIAGGADVILIPEIPYEPEKVAEAVLNRRRLGKRFSIVAVAEGAMSREQAETIGDLLEDKDKAKSKSEAKKISEKLKKFHASHVNNTLELTNTIETMTGVETRLTILGHLQRGGTPSARDRVLATKLGTKCAELLDEERYGVMVALRNGMPQAIALEKVAGRKKLVPIDHPLVKTARYVGTSFGD